MTEFGVRTSERTDFVDITERVGEAVHNADVKDGVCTVFVPHTTAAVTINENADPSVVADMKTGLDKIVPWTDNYRHAEGNSAAHIKSSLIGPSLQVLIRDGRLALGTWQGIYFCEFDGPRSRRVYVDVR